MIDNQCIIYMAGGNLLNCFVEEIQDGKVRAFIPNEDGVGNHSSAHFEIDLDHVQKIEFTGKRAEKGLEFIGLEY